MTGILGKAGIFVAGGLAAAGGMAIAQQQPAPRLVPNPTALRAAQGTTPQGEVDTLRNDVAQLKQQIAGLQNAQKTVATKGFDNAGRIGNLEKAFNAHSHHVTITAPTKTKDGWTFHFTQQDTTLPTQFCKQTKPLTASNPYTCTAP